MKYTIIILLCAFALTTQGQTLFKILERKKAATTYVVPPMAHYANAATDFFGIVTDSIPVWKSPGSFASLKENASDYEQGAAFATAWRGDLRRDQRDGFDIINTFWYWRSGDSINIRQAGNQLGGNGIPGTGTIIAIRHDNHAEQYVGPGINPVRFTSDNTPLTDLDNEAPASWGADNYHNTPSAVVPFIWGGNHGFHGVEVIQTGGTTLTYADVCWTGHDIHGHVWHVAHLNYGHWYLVSDNKSVDGGISFLYADSLEGTTLYHDSLGVNNTDSFTFTKVGDIDRIYTLTDALHMHYYVNGRLVTNDSQFYILNVFRFEQCETTNFYDVISGLRWAYLHRPPGGWTINPPLNHGDILWTQHNVTVFLDGGGAVLYAGPVLRHKMRASAFTNTQDVYLGAYRSNAFRRFTPGLDSLFDGAKSLQYSIGMAIKDTFYNAFRECYKDVWQDTAKPPLGRFDYVSDVINHLLFNYNFNMWRVPVLSLDSPLRQQEFKTAMELIGTRKDYHHNYFDSSNAMQDSGFTRKYVDVKDWWKRPSNTGKINWITAPVLDRTYCYGYFDRPGTYSFTIPPGKTFHLVPVMSDNNVAVSGNIITVSPRYKPVYYNNIPHNHGYVGGYLY